MRRARERGHILEGLTVALSNIDQMINLIKKSKDGNEARGKLLKKKWKAGKVKLRAKTVIEGEEEGKPRIVVSEIPYIVNKARLVENIAHLMRDKKIEGIKEIRDESDKDDPVRIVIELRSGAIADVVLNNLFKQTQMQTVFGINNVALVGTEPKLLNLKDMLGIFFNFRKRLYQKELSMN